MKAVIEANELKRIVDNTKRFVGVNDKRMEYIRLEIDAEKKMIRAIALDGYKLSVEYAKIQDADESFLCYIKPVIPKITRSTEHAVIELSGDRVLIQADESIMGYVQPSFDYYDVDKLIKEETEKKIIRTIGVNAKYLKDALVSAKDSMRSRDIIKIDVRNPNEPLMIRSMGYDGLPENIKIILPVLINKEIDNGRI
ncbi:hypothetical protein [Blautia producta]|uniref:DNA polymerase III subunit beta n=1 Tax=Blautia producta TaxID=33035 RepID=A0A4P6LRT4_9FIRM|nr:hypothetical protein [Blautia producta]QBE94522.1 hypothetical protein PMF13cell1_00011 [Blautia producta]